ncbi:sensor histidine kinase [Cellulomonas edaphi]|uniref:histidine kinase n=1 Tax=Cellulomonas edaphi TaxID=3053468 RepID=A0ABT7S9L6_9CELL|nr:ATP-binding protein [Cellulomons edaphi]MDM7832317.1 ATP-binding protein [Cellulomons edaphi]
MTQAPAPVLVESDEDLRSRGSRWLRALGRYIGPDAGVFERQLPFFLVFGVAMVVILFVPGVVTDRGRVVLAAGVAVAVLVSAWAVPWHRAHESAQMILPLMQLLAIALLRMGTGGNLSMFGSMVFIPIVLLAGRPSRLGALLGVLSVGVIVVVPVLLDPQAPVTGAAMGRSLFVMVVAGTITIIVHEATARLRARNAALAELQSTQLRLNAQLTLDAEALARLAHANDEAREQILSVMDAVTEQAIVATDAEGVIELFNRGAERLFQYPGTDVVGRMNLVKLQVREELEERYREAFDADGPSAAGAEDEDLFAAVAAPAIGGVQVRDWTFRRRDGSTGTMQLSAARRTDVHGSTVGYVIVATDVTAEREASRLKDEFVALVSHELRTPLSSVLGYLELILDGPDPLTEEQREFLLVVERNARRQLRLVSDLLLSAQLDAGTFSIDHRDVDLGDVARATLAEAGPAAEAAGVVLGLHVPDPVHVPGDATRLEQVLANLVSNAVKFTPRGGWVDVRVERAPEGGARVAVSDTGIGIAPDELDGLATRFFRASSATQRAIPGVGLGLSIAKAVVEAHGGELTVTSRVGEGTTFTFTLPGA